jgi:hypothetical protein
MIPAMLPKTRRSVAATVLTATVLAVFPATARADAGIAMLPMSYPTMLLFLGIVIAIEVIYLQAALRTRWFRTVMAVGALNAATAMLGFPLSWAIYIALDSWANFPGGQSGAFTNMRFLPMWVGLRVYPNWAGTPDQVWVTLGVFITLLVPGYLVSRYIKSWAINWYDLLRYNGDSRPSIMVANRLSYLLLAITGCMLLFKMYQSM